MAKKTASDESPTDRRQAFEQAAGGKSRGFVGEFVELLVHNKKWWLIPVVVVLLLVAALILLTSNPATAPFIYTLF